MWITVMKNPSVYLEHSSDDPVVRAEEWVTASIANNEDPIVLLYRNGHRAMQARQIDLNHLPVYPASNTDEEFSTILDFLEGMGRAVRVRTCCANKHGKRPAKNTGV